VEQAEVLLNNILSNDNDWTLPEPTPKPTPKKRGILFLSPEDMQEAKKSMKEKGIKAEDVNNLPPIEEIHGLNIPTQVVEVNSLYRFDEGDIPYNKSASQCLDEFDNFIVKQENFNAYVGRQLKRNAYMLERLGDYMSRTANDLRLISKHASMVTTQVEQILKAQNDLLNEMNSKNNDHDVRVMTRGGRMTQEPLYPEGHPKRIEQDSQRINTEAPSPPSNKKNKTTDRTLHASSEPTVDTPENPNVLEICPRGNNKMVIIIFPCS
jgi:hypothetical protein